MWFVLCRFEVVCCLLLVAVYWLLFVVRRVSSTVVCRLLFVVSRAKLRIGRWLFDVRCCVMFVVCSCVCVPSLLFVFAV